MTNKIKINMAALLAGAAFLLTGCWQKSLNPFYAKADLIGEPRLVGTWTDPEDKDENPEKWIFSQPVAKEFILKVERTGSEEELQFDTRVFKLGDMTFLDFYSRKRSVGEIPAHNLAQFKIESETLTLRMLSIAWMKKWLTAHPGELNYLEITNPENPANEDDKEFVLTSKTADLQKFILAHKNDPDFFNEPARLKRNNQ